jgi:hypothetical protein
LQINEIIRGGIVTEAVKSDFTAEKKPGIYNEEFKLLF